MRLVLFAFATLVAASAAGVTPGDAQSRGPKPWCIADGVYGAGTMDCTYWTLKQCTDTQRGLGGLCVENPTILWQRREEEQRRRGQPSSDRWRY